MTDREFADQLDAEERIRKHGYEKTICSNCHGTGIERAKLWVGLCYPCQGKGYEWVMPSPPSPPV